MAGWHPPARTSLRPTRYIGILVPSLDGYQVCVWLTSDRPAGTVFFAHSAHSFLSGDYRTMRTGSVKDSLSRITSSLSGAAPVIRKVSSGLTATSSVFRPVRSKTRI